MTQLANTSEDSFPVKLSKSMAQIGRALPKHITKERMTRICLTEWRNNPKLQKCSHLSILSSVIQAAQLGLEPGLLGRAYLVPYGTECQLIPGWRGLLDLCNRSGKAAAWTGAVFQGDDFEYGLGSSPYIKHVQKGESNPDKLTHVYACGKINNIDQVLIEAWPVQKIWAHRDKFNKVGKAHYSFSNQEMYARKVVLLQVLKYLPSSTEIDIAVQLANMAGNSEQKISVNDAINGTWSAVHDDVEPQPEEKEIKPPRRVEEEPNKEPHRFSFSDIKQMINDSGSNDEIDLALDVMDNLTKNEKQQLTIIATTKAKTFKKP